jgi:uncharacterized protein YjbJ (UPF0337 family)
MVSGPAFNSCEINPMRPFRNVVGAHPFYKRGETRTIMDRDRIKGMGDQAKGSMKDAAGKATGDAKLQAEGKMDKAKGKMENAAGGAKDTLRDQLNKHH